MAKAKNKVIAGDYEGKRSLLEINDKIYKALSKGCF